MEKTVQNNLLYANNKLRISVKTLFQKIKHIQKDELKKAMKNFTDDSFW